MVATSEAAGGGLDAVADVRLDVGRRPQGEARFALHPAGAHHDREHDQQRRLAHVAGRVDTRDVPRDGLESKVLPELVEVDLLVDREVELLTDVHRGMRQGSLQQLLDQEFGRGHHVSSNL